MKQSRAMSLIEAVANIAVGYGVAILVQMLVLPAFGLYATVTQHVQIGAIFTLASIARGYVLRRLFEALRLNGRT